MPFYYYVLKSVKNGILYKGSTQNLQQRVIYHNQGRVKYTAKNVPWELVLFEPFATRAVAVQREKWYKTGAGRDWIKAHLNNDWLR